MKRPSTRWLMALAMAAGGAVLFLSCACSCLALCGPYNQPNHINYFEQTTPPSTCS